jgi:sortase A
MKWIERLLWAGGCLTITYCVFLWAWASFNQAQGLHELERHAHSPGANPVEGALVGRIEIPRLHMSSIIFAGTGDSTLDRGVGYMIGSARPGERGNTVLAAHRDTFFRPLRNIQRGDEVSLFTPQGIYRYVIESTEIVDPDAIEVLRPSREGVLTLITCYPFQYIGSAPQRFVARGTSAPATAATATHLQPRP